MRPRTLDEVVGQEHLIGPAGVLRRMIEIGQADLHHIVGASGYRQDHAGSHHCAQDTLAISLL